MNRATRSNPEILTPSKCCPLFSQHQTFGGVMAAKILWRRHLISWLLAQATDRRMAHVVGPRNVGQHLSRLPASDRFSFLMAGQLRLPTEYYPPLLRPCPPLAGPCPDQFALELGETAQNGQHQATVRRRGVGPSISQRFDPAPFSAIVPNRLRRSRVDLANRSSRVTTSTSPFARTAIRRVSCFRSDRAPLIFS